jgi:hypothetical protein
MKFKRNGRIISYNVLKWDGEEGTRQESIAFGILKNEEQLRRFKSCDTIKDVLEIHNLGNVSQ